MSGERVRVIKERAAAFLSVAREFYDRGKLDMASFNTHQACQLRIKASILRLFGDIPRLHGIRELLGILAKRLKELNYAVESDRIVRFVEENRSLLIGIEDAYVESRYGVFIYNGRKVKGMIEVVDKLFILLEEIEGNVLG